MWTSFVRVPLVAVLVGLGGTALAQSTPSQCAATVRERLQQCAAEFPDPATQGPERIACLTNAAAELQECLGTAAAETLTGDEAFVHILLVMLAAADFTEGELADPELFNQPSLRGEDPHGLLVDLRDALVNSVSESLSKSECARAHANRLAFCRFANVPRHFRRFCEQTSHLILKKCQGK
jgi:hypothetical protein